LNLTLGNQLLAEGDANLLDRRLRVVFLGHAIDRHLAEFLAVDEMHDEDFFVARSAMRVDPEDFALVFKFSNNVPRRLFSFGLATIWIRIYLLRCTKREAMTGYGDEAIQSSSETVVLVWIPSLR
jgi:hypothetical protein